MGNPLQQPLAPNILSALKDIESGLVTLDDPTILVKHNVWPNGDSVACLCVLDQIDMPAKLKALEKISNRYNRAYIRMNGNKFGFTTLSIFFWSIVPFGNPCDHIWLCSNSQAGATYKNIKRHNLLGGRSVMSKTLASGESTVVKREVHSFAHYWIKTDIRHESEVYDSFHTLDAPFAKKIGYSEDGTFRCLELQEIVDTGTTASPAEIKKIISFLFDNKLFVIDLLPDQIIRSIDSTYMVDLESAFIYSSSPYEVIDMRVRDCEREKFFPRKKPLQLDSMEDQWRFFASRLHMAAD